MMNFIPSEVLSSMMLRSISLLIALILIEAIAPASSPAFTVKFKKLVDSNTPAPGTNKKLLAIGNASISGNNLVFQANTDNPSSEFRGTFGLSEEPIYGILNGQLIAIPNPIPSLPVNQVAFGTPSISGNTIAFAARDRDLSNQFPKKPNLSSGIYQFSNGKLVTVATRGSQTNRGEQLVEFNCYDAAKYCYSTAAVAIDQGSVIFPGTVKVGTTLKTGIYRAQDGTIQTIADGSMMRPKNDGPFSFQSVDTSGNIEASYSYPVASTIGNKVGFASQKFLNIPTTTYSPALEGGIYLKQGGTTRTIADSKTNAPNNGKPFISFGTPSISSQGIAFFGKTNYQQLGVYYKSQGNIKTIVSASNESSPTAPTDSNLPTLSLPYKAFGNVCTAGSLTAFSGSSTLPTRNGDQTQSGWYINYKNTTQLIIELDNFSGTPKKMFDGKAVIAFQAGTHYCDSTGMVITVLFKDKSTAMYRFDVAD
jgi:hypothetical protein